MSSAVGGTGEASGAGWPGWLRRFLRVRLGAKLAGANGLLVVTASILFVTVYDGGFHEPRLAAVMVAALLATVLLVNLMLVHLALRPLRDLEWTASRIWDGDLAARVPASPLADKDVRRVGETINALLDRLIADRTRIRGLASQVIQVGDRERARIARELHDSTAQTLAALTFQARSVLRAVTDPELRVQLELIRDHAVDALEEVRRLSHTVHPRVLDDLGVAAALERLARRTREEQGTSAAVAVLGDAGAIPRPIGSVLYSIAQEAVSNALRHGAPRSIEITLSAGGNVACLEVIDDGRGFELDEARLRRPGMGLFAMAERASLADGMLEIDTGPGRGTRVTATIPTTVSDAP